MVRHTGEDFIDVERVAVSSVFSFQAPSVDSSEFDTPEADRFAANGDATFGEQIFNIPMTEIEAIVEPNCVADNFRRESVAFVSIHLPILSISAS